MDHTLIRYNTELFEETVYNFAIQHFIAKKNYPQQISGLPFNFDRAIRGLVIDAERGNILKLSQFSAIKQSQHGNHPLTFHEQQKLYRGTCVDLNDPRFIAIDTAFSIAFCVLYANLVGFKDNTPISMPSYEVLARDSLEVIDLIHADGSLKSHIIENLNNYIIQDPKVVQGIERYKKFGKKFFILTNSEYYYTKILLDHAINPHLTMHKSWQELFTWVITKSCKPRFFYENNPFLKLNDTTETMEPFNGSILNGGIFSGGNAHQFTEQLEIIGEDILYIGDHIYGDVVRLKKDCNWRTALVVEELDKESKAHNLAVKIDEKIHDLMQQKIKLEAMQTQLLSKKIEENSSQYDTEINNYHDEINDLDKQISPLLKQQATFYNAFWGNMFRTGAEISFFSYQMERYACIYMHTLASLFALSPLSYFRAERKSLPHENL